MCYFRALSAAGMPVTTANTKVSLEYVLLLECVLPAGMPVTTANTKVLGFGSKV
jgi:hypothetical protein